jgi:integrase
VTRHGHVAAGELTSGTVARVVKSAAASIGLDPARFSGHSLRAGLATSAAKAGKEERHIMRHLGHRSEAMTRRYVREANVFDNNAADGLL